MNTAQKTIAAGLKVSKSIAAVELCAGALARTPAVIASHFEPGPLLLVADENTWQAAGQPLAACLQTAGLRFETLMLPAKPKPKPSVELAGRIAERLSAARHTPVAVGSGVINDLVKYAAFTTGQPYLCVATAASMDGYTSAGAPLSERGFKKTIQCRPPKAIIADLEVLRNAPRVMSSWGYSDLAGKIPAGADWILADELGIEPIEPQSWSMVQANLPDFLSRPLDVARGDGGAIEDLFAGLAVVGFAMELHGSSRPASGADHQIAHLWEMQDLAHEGEPVSHGSCVAVGALTALKLYDWFLRLDIENLDIEAALAHYRSLSQKSDDIRDRFGTSEICSRSIEETRLKYVDRDSLRNRLSLLKACWPQLKQRLRAQILTPGAFSEKLGAAGAPTSSAAIGVDSGHLRQTVLSALYLRSRYTILDILDDIGLLKDAVGTLTAD